MTATGATFAINIPSGEVGVRSVVTSVCLCTILTSNGALVEMVKIPIIVRVGALRSSTICASPSSAGALRVAPTQKVPPVPSASTPTTPPTEVQEPLETFSERMSSRPSLSYVGKRGFEGERSRSRPRKKARLEGPARLHVWNGMDFLNPEVVREPMYLYLTMRPRCQSILATLIRGERASSKMKNLPRIGFSCLCR